MKLIIHWDHDIAYVLRVRENKIKQNRIKKKQKTCDFRNLTSITVTEILKGLNFRNDIIAVPHVYVLCEKKKKGSFVFTIRLFMQR